MHISYLGSVALYDINPEDPKSTAILVPHSMNVNAIVLMSWNNDVQGNKNLARISFIFTLWVFEFLAL
jgi:hypothetical protein